MIRMIYDPIFGVRYFCDDQLPIADNANPSSTQYQEQITRQQNHVAKIRHNNTKQK